MLILHTVRETQEYVISAKNEGKSVGFVPTMGFFHEGHLSLMRRARSENDIVVVSIFVNPTQFGPGEDFEQYPRDMSRDVRMAEDIGVDVIFNPSVEEMYPAGYSSYVDIKHVTERWEGEFRPGHFKGVATVVLKLFNIVPAHRAYFGCKDYQQLKVVERMVRDLNIPIDIVPMPTVREDDGLAMSSRNTYLTQEERKAALILCRSLNYAKDLLEQGVRDGDELRRQIEQFIRTEPLAQLDYVGVADPETLEPLRVITTNAVVLLAVRIGRTRLIDNMMLSVT